MGRVCCLRLVDLPHSFFRNPAHETPAKWPSAGNIFSKTYGPRPRDVTVSSREGGIMAEEAPPRARSRWNGIVLFFV